MTLLSAKKSLAHGTTNHQPHHVALAGMTTALVLASRAQAGLVQAHLALVAGIQVLAQATVQVHQAGINYVFC